jgi:hypothetical protein
MELLYFISGILFGLTVYGALKLRSATNAVKDALERLQSHQNISSLRFEEMREQVEETKIMMLDIQKDMEEDSYDTVLNINKRLELLEKIEDATGKDLREFKLNTETAFKQASGDIQTLKNNLKALGQDPNFLNRY